jgi:hypothetical protein
MYIRLTSARGESVVYVRSTEQVVPEKANNRGTNKYIVLTIRPLFGASAWKAELGRARVIWHGLLLL